MTARERPSIEQEAGMLLGDTDDSGAVILAKVLGGSSLPMGEEELKEGAQARINKIGDPSFSLDLDKGVKELIGYGLAEKVTLLELTPRGRQVFDLLFSPHDPNTP